MSACSASCSALQKSSAARCRPVPGNSSVASLSLSSAASAKGVPLHAVSLHWWLSLACLGRGQNRLTEHFLLRLVSYFCGLAVSRNSAFQLSLSCRSCLRVTPGLLRCSWCLRLLALTLALASTVAVAGVALAGAALALAAFPLALASALAALAFLGAGSEGFAPAWLSAEVFAALATFSVTKASPN